MSVKENIENKIMTHLEDALDIISTWKNNKEKIVFTNGCFDLFHAGHAHSLADAAKYGTKLIVGLNDDSSVHKLKGKNRPFNNLSSRAFVLASLQAVDLVIPFSELNPENLIQTIIPDVLAKGSDYSLENIVGAAFVLENKGEVVRIPLLPDISSTKIADFMIKKIPRMQTKIQDVIRVLSSHAPLSWQEDYDNCGLLVGDHQTVITGITTCLDVTLEVINETIQNGANLIVSHHPIIFKPLKKLSQGGFVENILLKAIKNDIAIYVIHTNLDNAYHRGINETLAKIIGLNNRSILQEKQGLLSQLQCVLSENEANTILPQLNLLKPHSFSYQAGKANMSEGKLSMVLLNHQLSEACQMIDSSTGKNPFKEITEVKNTSHLVGAGMVGYLDQPMPPVDFLDLLKNALSLKVIKHTFLCKDKIHKVAICGGSGSFLLTDAIRAQADIFVTSDYKYHQFQEANNKIIIADIGHYESEVCAINLIKQIISEKFTNFVIRSTTVVTNPVYYHQ